MLAVIREARDGFLAIDSRRPLVDPADPSLEKRAIIGALRLSRGRLATAGEREAGRHGRMRERPYPRFSEVRWDHVDWLWHHPEHIDRRAPSQEEAIALWKVRTGNRLLLETIDTPTDPPVPSALRPGEAPPAPAGLL